MYKICSHCLLWLVLYRYGSHQAVLPGLRIRQCYSLLWKLCEKSCTLPWQHCQYYRMLSWLHSNERHGNPTSSMTCRHSYRTIIVASCYGKLQAMSHVAMFTLRAVFPVTCHGYTAKPRIVICNIDSIDYTLSSLIDTLTSCSFLSLFLQVGSYVHKCECTYG